MRIKAVRVKPTKGPSGSRKPIQNANSIGRSASAIRTPARPCSHSIHPVRSSATQTSRNNPRRGTVVSIPISSKGPAP